MIETIGIGRTGTGKMRIEETDQGRTGTGRRSLEMREGGAGVTIDIGDK